GVPTPGYSLCTGHLPDPLITSYNLNRGVALGGAMTVRCQGQHQNMRFLLYKDRNPTALQYADPSGNVAEFPICNMNQRDAGSYSCSYCSKMYLLPADNCLRPSNSGGVHRLVCHANKHTRPMVVWSEPSDFVELVSRPWSYPKPSISVSPGGVIPIGGNVTIQCWHQRLGMRILPCKAGDGNYLTYTDPAGSEAEFPITSARREHGGSYTCRCSNRSVQAGYSEPSYPVQIIVAAFPCAPVGRLLWGGAVTIRCECRCRGARVLLSKAGNPDAWCSIDPVEDVAEFPICDISWRDTGSYSCRYSTMWDHPVLSYPSDPMELVVAGERPGSASLFPAPHPAGPSGGLALFMLGNLCSQASVHSTRSGFSIFVRSVTGATMSLNPFTNLL
uniref:Ig-like domain-containing protein n=1 Tax=Gopherus agassizii TaxID=38772 RepID=A0A452HVA5_9SAUR